MIAYQIKTDKFTDMNGIAIYIDIEGYFERRVFWDTI